MKNLFSHIQEIVQRLHLLWVAFYIALFTSSYAYASSLYQEYNEDQLPGGHIELLVGKTEYQLGEVVDFTVSNYFPTTVYVTNHCPEEPLSVYRWENEQWVELHDKAQGEGSTCDTQERNVAIPPDGSIQYNFSAWPNLFKEPGVYRIAMVVDHYTSVPFQDFVVLKPAEVVEVMEPLQKRVVTPAPVPVPAVVPVPVVLPEPEVVPEVVEEPVEEEHEEEEEREDEEEEEDDD